MLKGLSEPWGVIYLFCVSEDGCVLTALYCQPRKLGVQERDHHFTPIFPHYPQALLSNVVSELLPQSHTLPTPTPPLLVAFQGKSSEIKPPVSHTSVLLGIYT